jgi:hypothetical protein
MAQVRQRGKAWQAIVARNGHRTSRTFNTDGEARAWALAEEQRLMSLVPEDIKQQGRGQARRHRVIAARSAEHLLRRAVPYPRICGVYFLVKDSTIVYVGQSTDVMGRLSEHCKNGRPFEKFAYIEEPECMLVAVERAYIVALAPRWNIHSNGTAGTGGQDGFYS